jgi:hypothetical protein
MIGALLLSISMVVAGVDGSHEPRKPLPTIYGIATWYAPRNNPWYLRDGAGFKLANQRGAPYFRYAAAGPALRQLMPFKWGGKPYRIRITSMRTGKVAYAWVVDTCACNSKDRPHLVDLAPIVFSQDLGVRLGIGIQRVKVEVMP